MPFQLQLLLKQLESLLQGYQSPQDPQNPVLQKVISLHFKVDECSQTPEHLLLVITGNNRNASLLKADLMRRLKKDMTTQQFRHAYQKQLLDESGQYKISMRQLDILLADILQGIRPMNEELNLFEDYFEQNLRTANVDDKEIRQNSKYQLGCLLKMLVQNSDLDLDHPNDEILFRIFVLWESLEVLMAKSQFLLDKLTDVVKAKPAPKTKPKEDTIKKSALSESVALYKMNQLKEKIDKEKTTAKKTCKYFSNTTNIICGDFKIRRKRSPREQRITAMNKRCCYGF